MFPGPGQSWGDSWPRGRSAPCLFRHKSSEKNTGNFYSGVRRSQDSWEDSGASSPVKQTDQSGHPHPGAEGVGEGKRASHLDVYLPQKERCGTKVRVQGGAVSRPLLQHQKKHSQEVPSTQQRLFEHQSSDGLIGLTVNAGILQREAWTGQGRCSESIPRVFPGHKHNHEPFYLRQLKPPTTWRYRHRKHHLHNHLYCPKNEKEYLKSQFRLTFRI